METRMVVIPFPAQPHWQPSNCSKNNILQMLQKSVNIHMDALEEIQTRHPSIGDVRGKGLMIGVEFVKDKSTKEPNEAIRDMIEKHGFQHGLLLLGCGKSTIRLAPPLCITKQEIDEGLEIFEYVITMAEQEQGLR